MIRQIEPKMVGVVPLVGAMKMVEMGYKLRAGWACNRGCAELSGVETK